MIFFRFVLISYRKPGLLLGPFLTICLLQRYFADFLFLFIFYYIYIKHFAFQYLELSHIFVEIHRSGVSKVTFAVFESSCH